MKRYRLAEQAVADLDSIASYIASDNPTAAFDWLDEIFSKLEDLGRYPQMGRAREELASGLRSLLIGDYVVFYRDNDDFVMVVRVLHGAQDHPRLFENG